jgi:hypothetical protein
MLDFSAIKKRQSYLLWGVGVILMGAAIAYGWFFMEGGATTPLKEFKGSLATGASRTNPQEAWVYESREEAKLASKRLDTMEKMLLKLLKLNETRALKSKDSKDTIQVIGEIRKDLKDVQMMDTSPPPQQISQKNIPDQKTCGDSTPIKDNVKDARVGQGPEKAATDSNPGSSPAQPPGVSSSSSRIGASGETSQQDSQNLLSSTPPFRSRGLRKIAISLKNARSHASLKTVDNTIPAGAFAKAILLGGVDASASIQASSDPRPALLRLTDPGTLPRKFHADLKGCHVLAACYGDISSERVFMRLEKLTCTERKTGEIWEVKVQGYVAGEDGRTGVRGTVVDRAGESMRSAMIGGFLGGIGEFLSQSQNAVTFSPVAGLAQTGSLTQANPMGMKDMMKHGAGKGAQNALDKYADFYIKRAEQVQPVIQVAAGRQVDIVLTEGVFVEDSLYRQALGRSNDKGRYSDIAAMQKYQEPGARHQESGQQPEGLSYWNHTKD